VVPLPMPMAELVRLAGGGPSGRAQLAQVILTGCGLDAAQAALAALGPVRT
jgi:hypothetical protein